MTCISHTSTQLQYSTRTSSGFRQSAVSVSAPVWSTNISSIDPTNLYWVVVQFDWVDVYTTKTMTKTDMHARSSISFIAGNRHSETLISDLLALASIVLRPLFGNPIVSFITLLLDALTWFLQPAHSNRLWLITESALFPKLWAPQGISPKFASTSEKVPTSICVFSGWFPVVSYVSSVAP